MPEEQLASKYVLAIDLGTGGPKVGLVDQDAQVIASASAPVKVIFLPNNGAEHDPTEWWSAINTCVHKVLQTSQLAPEQIIAVAVTSLWSVILPVDENGEPLMNCISWMDGRGAPYNREIVKGFPQVQGYKLSTLLKYVDLCGLPPTLKGVDNLGHMLFIKHERPEIYRRTYKFFEPMDYINMRLTGKFAGTQNSVLAYIMMDNRRLDRKDYDPWMVKNSGIDRDKLPDLVPIDAILGTITPSIAKDWGLSPNTVVVTGVTDNSSSAIGAGAIADYEAAVVMGTSGFISIHVPFKKTDIESSSLSIPSAIPGRYLFSGDLTNTGKVLDSYLQNIVFAQDAFGDNILPTDVYQRADQLIATVAPGSEGVLFWPWFNGIMCPHEDPYMRGGFLNLTPKTTRAHMTRAVYEGIAMNFRWLRIAVEKAIKHPATHWRVTGGGALSNEWLQIMADIVGIPMHQQADPRNSNVIGTAMLAFNRLGIIRLEDIPNKIKFSGIFEPNSKNRAIYDKMFTQFMASKDKIQPVFHALNKDI